MSYAIGIIEDNGVKVAELTGTKGSVQGPQAVHDIIEAVAFNHRVDRVLADRALIGEKFFDLRSGFAGELTQKFTNYRMRLAVFGNFRFIESIALKAFIHESNLGKTVRFFPDRAAALEWLVKG